MYKDFDSEKVYKELYYHELNLKDKISNRTNFAFGTIVFIYNKSIEYFSLEIPGVFILIILILLGLSFGISIFFVLKSYYGYPYEYIPPAPPKPIKSQKINENFTLEVEKNTTDDSNSK